MPNVAHQLRQETSGAGKIPVRRILLVAPSPPPYGGMALQARLLERLLRDDGQEVIFVSSNPNLDGQFRFLQETRGLRAVARLFLLCRALSKQVRPLDVVHIFAASWLYFFLVVYPAVIVGRIRGGKVILNYRGGEAKKFFRQFAWAAKPVFHLSHVVTAPSEFLAGYLRERFRIPVAIVPNILDGARFPYRIRPSFGPKLLVTRHLEKMYDIESVLMAFRVIQKEHREASLWIAGGGSQGFELRKLASELQLENVRFLGSVSHRDLAGIIDRRDILLNASRVDNFPGALLEASGAGLVVVSTSPGGIPYIYQNERDAILVEPGDWAGLARGVSRVIRCPGLARGLAKRGAELARSCYWTEVRRVLYQVYDFPVAQTSGELAGVGA